MRTLLTSLILTTSLLAYSQKYETEEVIRTAKSYLEDAVGTELMPFFELDSNSYYEYKSSFGKRKWERIIKGERTKGKFIKAHNIRFTLKHPEFLFAPSSYRTVYIKLDSALQLESNIDLERIPDFILNNTKSNWLTAQEIQQIANKQNLKNGIKPISIHINYDVKSKKYFWGITNTLAEEPTYSDCEILNIDPISGEILRHTEERLFPMHYH